jgi:hypothetical protein
MMARTSFIPSPSNAIITKTESGTVARASTERQMVVGPVAALDGIEDKFMGIDEPVDCIDLTSETLVLQLRHFIEN